MVDWNKDVKLSDLIGRKPKAAEESIAPAPEEFGKDVQAAAETSAPPAPTPAAPVAVSPAPPAPPAPAQAPPTAVEAEPQPEPTGERESAEPPTELEPEIPTERVPWYKRELSFGGNKQEKPK